MHLHHPSLSFNGHRKGKPKFRNAESARAARELEENWTKLKTKWGVTVENKKKTSKNFKPYGVKQEVYIRETGPKPPSLNPHDMSPAPRAADKVYTGTKLIGIGTMHKSNMVPIFSDSEAQDIAHMRR
jgi:hypothetical protein